MCSVSKVNEMMGLQQATHAAGGLPSSSILLSPIKFKHSRDQFFLVDIREADEIETNPLPEDALVDAAMTMGKLFHVAGTTEGDGATVEQWKKSGKTIVLICNTGLRASITASHLSSSAGFGSKVAALQRGILGLKNAAAVIPDFCVVLATKSEAEKITLAVTACANAATAGETVVLALMGDGVCAFLRKGSNKEDRSPSSLRVEEIFVGEPFKPVDALLKKFIGSGNGVVLACTSCVESRGIEFGSDLHDYVQPMQMPDLLRMMGECKKSMQFM